MSHQYLPYKRVHNDCPDFKMYEVFKSETAVRKEIDNEQGFNYGIADKTADLVSIFLQPLRILVDRPIRISSWYRCEALESILCSKAFEKWMNKDSTRRLYEGNDAFLWDQYFKLKSHPKGNAVDFEIPGISNDEVYDLIISEELPFDQLIREYAVKGDPMSGWIHVSAFADNDLNRYQAFTQP